MNSFGQETVCPLRRFGFELKAKGYALEVGQFEQGAAIVSLSVSKVKLIAGGRSWCEVGSAKKRPIRHVIKTETYRAPSQLGILIIMIMIVRSLSITQHGSRPRERVRVSRVGICVKEQSQSLEFV